MGNGNRAAQKRERNAGKGPKEAKSQLKSNAAALSIKCKTCFQSFQSTTNRNTLGDHAANRHNKGFAECFEEGDGVAR